MFKKTLKKIKELRSDSHSVDTEEMQSFLSDIEAIEKEIANKKAIIKQEHEDGARITSHRFTL
ncbi:hypothetical protein AB6864_00735 [Serratia proteamaculans]|jgi:uncharacterized protein (UPF0335 family)|uniref:hypothetical protein n=1 Tax=Serratia proteamaculans TaxID=28151 RepID=UPI00059D743F